MPTSKHVRGTSELKRDAAFQKRLATEKRRLGGLLLALRRGAGWTQEEAAAEIGIHEKYLSRVENGMTNPTVEVLMAVAEAYGVELEQLFKR